MFAAGVSENAAGNGTESLEERAETGSSPQKSFQDVTCITVPGEPPAWISLDARYISEGADGIVYLVSAPMSLISRKKNRNCGL